MPKSFPSRFFEGGSLPGQVLERICGPSEKALYKVERSTGLLPCQWVGTE